MSTPAPNVYKNSLNLPRTDFAMEAKLVATEPPRLQKWQQMKLYQRIMEARRGAATWVLHDGPPFANGDIHLGHVINKTLKDVILRFRTMQNRRTPYVPGWDCHGLPIEQKIQDELGPRLRQLSTTEVRQRCHDYAAKYAAVQSQQFQRLGILGDWEHPYMTMAPFYEAATLEVFARFVEAGLVYKKLKPVPWSVANQTALADAELEYKDKEDPSVYVEFAAIDPAAVLSLFGQPAPADAAVHFLIWTTTPWTLPANLAIAVHPEVEYALVRYTRNARQRLAVVAADLVGTVFSGRAAVSQHQVLGTVKGQALVQQQYSHPFVQRSGRLLPAGYVTTTDGTGLVHTAPGHGEDDYATGITHGLQVYCPVLHNGRFDDTVPPWLAGLSVWDANPLIIQKLAELDVLFDQGTVLHSYPHDWRSKKPVIQRATEQWFVGVDMPFVTEGSPEPRSLRQRAIDIVQRVQFIPDWGRARILGMLQSRPDWCISRQRSWGLPIPVFYNQRGQALLTPTSVRAVARAFAAKGSDCWFTDSPAQLLEGCQLPADFSAAELRKEQDIFDVWFESGSSWNAVLRQSPELRFPCDLYLEGSDQHRGWFQLSLLACLGATGQAPFQQVLTHGFVVGSTGEKVSKSSKDYVTATTEINRHGADLLRLWCCSVDYQGDIATSPQIIQKFGDKYRKIRNTLRYLLSNLYDFDPARDAVAAPDQSLDAWALAELRKLVREVTAAYDGYQLHWAFRLLHDFCAVQISAVYGNAMKDRLYCELPHSPLRRRCQTVMHQMATALVKLLAPMVVFTADEAWEHLRRSGAEADMPSVHLALLPQGGDEEPSDAQQEQWRLLMELRDQALLQLDNLKKQAGLNKPLDAEIIYRVDDPQLKRRLEAYGVDLADMVGAGFHSIVEKDPAGPAVVVQVVDRRGTYPACARSWKRRPDVGQDAQFPELCARDAAVMRALGTGGKP
jgi:isoleucyl-tRNA synthetase